MWHFQKSPCQQLQGPVTLCELYAECFDEKLQLCAQIASFVWKNEDSDVLCLAELKVQPRVLV